MSNFTRALRQAMTVARRDFVATVFTPTFLIFLLSPMLTIAFSAVGGIGAASTSPLRPVTSARACAAGSANGFWISIRARRRPPNATRNCLSASVTAAA